jgi:hypothetical protein
VNSYVVVFNQNNSGLTGGSTLMKTTNLGVNWLPNTSMGSGNFCGIAGVFTQWWWYVRSDNKVYISGNYGANWIVQNTASAGIYTHMFYSGNGMFIYAIRDNGGISKYIIWVGVKKISSEVPETFNLYQNYPNPFNPSTKIKFDISQSVILTPSSQGKNPYITLKIYDILGKEVLHLSMNN